MPRKNAFNTTFEVTYWTDGVKNADAPIFQEIKEDKKHRMPKQILRKTIMYMYCKTRTLKYQEKYVSRTNKPKQHKDNMKLIHA